MDWDKFNNATELISKGRPEESLSLYQSLDNQGETADDRAALLLACGRCYALIGDRFQAFRCVAEAHSLNIADPAVKSQVEFSEANLLLWVREFQFAAEKFRTIRTTYQDVLRNPEHQDFAQELKSRYADSLTFLGEYAEAIPLLQELIASDAEVRQHSFLYLGICLVNSGATKEGRQALLEATLGDDEQTSDDARKRLAQLG